MTIRSILRRLIPRTVPKMSLHTVLAVPFVFQTVGAVGVVGYLSYLDGQAAVTDLANRLTDEVSQRVQQQLQPYLEIPRVINKINVNSIELGYIQLDRPETLTRAFWRQRDLFEPANASSVYYGNAKGEFVGLGFQGDQTWQISNVGRATDYHFYSYTVDANGNRARLLTKGKPYDPRIRPWYRKAEAAGKRVWSDIYVDFKEKRLKITLANPVYEPNGDLRGVLGVDFALQHVTTFLQKVKVGEAGHVLILERTGDLVASSAEDVTAIGKNRVSAVASSNELIRATMQQMWKQVNVAQIKTSQPFSFDLKGKRQLVRVTPYVDQLGLDWLIVVIVPESEFMAKIHDSTQKTILLCLGTLGAAIAFGSMAARWVTRPLSRFSEASQKIASGELNQQVTVSQIRELDLLSASFNQMSREIQNSHMQLGDYARSLEQKVSDRTQALESEIQERQRVQDDLSAQQIFLRKVIDVVPSHIFVKDREGRFLVANQATASIYDTTVEEIEGRLDIDFNPNPEQVEQFLAINREVMETLQPKSTMVQPITTPDGETRWYQTYVSPFVGEDGQVLGVIGSASDITALKGVEEELRHAKDAAEAANLAKSTFLASMSHELRSPLNAILGFAQLLKRSGCPPEYQDNVRIIIRSGEHLLTLINNVLDLSKIEAGRTTLNTTDFDLYHLLQDVENMCRWQADEKHLYLSLNYDAAVPQWIHSDPVKLRQVLLNLLSNGLKFTKVGGVTVRVYASAPQTLNFEVEDTGVGIAASEVENLFEAFVQTDSGKAIQSGTGLGLTISRKFIQLMGGDITVSSELDRGTRFQFSITLVPSNRAEVRSPNRQVIGLEPGQMTYRILVVDDKHTNRLLLVKLLAPLGFEIKEANNGAEAIAIWEQWEPHLIWMDMRMPVMDGYEATMRIKSTSRGKETPVIALTASALEQDEAVILQMGCDGFVRKPFQESEIFETMQKYLGVRYEYANELPLAASEDLSILTSASLKKLPRVWITDLNRAILNGDLEAVQTVTEQIAIEHVDLAIALKQQINNFNYEQLLELIKVALREEQEIL